MNEPNIALFFDNTIYNPTNGCLEWTGIKNKKGYGRCNVRGTVYLAHRLSYFICFRYDPGSLCVLHHCDNPACVNPKHLFIGSKADNNEDMRSKGRAADQIGTHARISGDKHGRKTKPESFPRGENIHNAKIKDSQVLYIVNSFNTRTRTAKELASEFNCHYSTIYNIVTNKSYIHVKRND